MNEKIYDSIEDYIHLALFLLISTFAFTYF